MKKFWLTVRVLVFSSLSVVTLASQALAQEPKWEIEGHAGRFFAFGGPSGATALPAAGVSFTTASGLPSRRVSSWLFGDGAELLDEVVRALPPDTVPPRQPPQTVPLDGVLHRPLIERKNGAVFGFRFGRRVASRWIAEVGVDRLPTIAKGSHARDQYVATAAMYETVWNDVFFSLGSPFVSPSGATINFVLPEARQDRIVVTGAANFEFAPSARVRPYLLGGAGIENRSGDSPTSRMSATIEYTTFLIGRQIQENDRVEMRGTTKKTRPVAVVGGGARFPITERFGVRADARAYLSKNGEETFVSTLTPPTRIAGPSTFYFDTGTTPAIQFQSVPRPEPDSEVSFSGPQISNFRTFEGNGLEVDFGLTVGGYWRF